VQVPLVAETIAAPHGPLVFHGPVISCASHAPTVSHAALVSRAPLVSDVAVSHAALLPGARRLNDGEAVCPQRLVHLGPPAPIFGAIPLVGRLAATPVHDDFEVVIGAQRRLEGRDEIAAAEPIARDDAQAPTLISHSWSSCSNVDAEWESRGKYPE